LAAALCTQAVARSADESRDAQAAAAAPLAAARWVVLVPEVLVPEVLSALVAPALQALSSPEAR